MNELVTVYDVEYKQTVNRGSRHQRVNWVRLGTFTYKRDAKVIASQHPDSRVVEHDADAEWAYNNCEEIDDTGRDHPHLDM